jgi:hypothetical protein
VGLTALLAIIATVTWMPFGAPTFASGPIKNVGVVNYRSNTWRYAIVALPGGQVRVDNFGRVHCALGSWVSIRRQQYLLGPKYTPASTLCLTP